MALRQQERSAYFASAQKAIIEAWTNEEYAEMVMERATIERALLGCYCKDRTHLKTKLSEAKKQGLKEVEFWGPEVKNIYWNHLRGTGIQIPVINLMSGTESKPLRRKRRDRKTN